MKNILINSVSIGMLLLLSVVMASGKEEGPGGASNSVHLEKGWRLWLDRTAEWKDDVLYLPEEVNLSKLPVNPPSGGWSVLSKTAGIPVTLPGTVEEYYWDKGTDSMLPAEILKTERPYLGVSWWYCSFKAPSLKSGERLILSIPSARMRAEVYVNGKLVGYNLITELPFTADATDAVKPGSSNQLAIRITNPGGNYIWNDTSTFKWGKYDIPVSHGFGGLSDGLTMAVRAPVAVQDLTVLNTPDPRTVHLTAEVTSAGPAYEGPLSFEIRKKGKKVWSGTGAIKVPVHGVGRVSVDATVPDADLWDIGHPSLYSATADIPSMKHADWTTVFGFRWFTAEGVGSNATLRLNGRRVVLRSAISWGFWAPNGMFPDEDAVQREIDAVEAIGLNGLHNHRHMPNKNVISGFDRAGLLRYCEPGAGLMAYNNFDVTNAVINTSGKGGEPTSFCGRYERAKILGMVKTFRSHPSVPLWTIQNESEPDLRNPKIFQILREMKALDPSRIVALKSGALPRNQAWALPYSDEFMYDHGDGYSGWWDLHTACDSAGVYTDGLYQNPQNFKYRCPNKREIVAWGEMSSGASSDNHEAIEQWYKKNKRSGYDRAAHATLAAVYEKYLDDYHFRSAFPTAAVLFQGIGNKHYYSAARLMENARMSDDVDYIVLNGWESTAVENHSGIVDSLRQLKGDIPDLKEANAPTMLVVRPRHLVIAKGTAAMVDVHLVNDTSLKGTFTLKVEASSGKQKPFFAQEYPVTVTGGETFAELLKEQISFKASKPGSITITASLTASKKSKPVLSRTAQMLVVDPSPAPIQKTVAYAGKSDRVADALQRDFGIKAVPLSEAGDEVDVIMADTSIGVVWHPDSVAHVENTDDPGLYTTQRFGGAGLQFVYRGLEQGPVKVELFFAETCWSEPGKRKFDVALNGKVVLKDFDLVAETGGKGRALVKTFTVDSSDGKVEFSIPRVGVDQALIAALRITDSKNKVIREVFRPQPYKDVKGAVWKPVGQNNVLASIPSMLERVRKGSRLIFLANNGDDAGKVAEALAKEKLLDYKGLVGHEAAYMAWMGYWYFGKQHWLLDGLPSNCVLDWPYQVTCQGSNNGLMIQAPKLDAVIGYGRDHCTDIGVSAAVLPVGKGDIVIFCLPGLSPTFLAGGDRGFHPVTAKRVIYNAIEGGR